MSNWLKNQIILFRVTLWIWTTITGEMFTDDLSMCYRNNNPSTTPVVLPVGFFSKDRTRIDESESHTAYISYTFRSYNCFCVRKRYLRKVFSNVRTSTTTFSKTMYILM